MAASTWYRAGTITIQADSKTVTGTNTRWNDPKQGVGAGQILLVPGAGSVQMYEIVSVESDTHLTLNDSWAGDTVTDSVYAIPTGIIGMKETLVLSTVARLGYYQQQLDGWQKIMTGDGDVTIEAPDGTEITISSFKKLNDDINLKANITDVLEKDDNLAGLADKLISRNNLGFLNGVLPVSLGGTGATTKADAWAALLEGLITPLSVKQGGTGATTKADAWAALATYGTTAGTAAQGNDSRITGALPKSGGDLTGSPRMTSNMAYLSNAASARYTLGGITYLDIIRMSQIDIGVGTAGVLQFVANPGNALSFELSPGNGTHSFRHDGKIITNAGTVQISASDERIKTKRGKPVGTAYERIMALAAGAVQDYNWLNYQDDINEYFYQQPQRGFMAQSAFAVDPVYASKPKDGADSEMPEGGDQIWGLNTNAILADAVLAISEIEEKYAAMFSELQARMKAIDGHDAKISEPERSS
ncbi:MULTISPECIES: tail fiber domain-containing protein [unclassified Erwinia]|uniref:tail fiber domain-containing protein n=1 Tax=unclassified Erwinia TaxID=2622719 RepID=UPI000C17AF01|nr:MULTISPECIES: tail fiber domain-containing protein [unclassified Erwinia]PIJ48384.1 hypothetical protein BV501_17345 [Erwinia sp. OAMSP11]PIJ79879.1 hypothetical protein BLD47_12445 [Erwinia sp. OLCASP19]PIJ81047.1 hypothetical protein BLD46_13255 [Erwinia sp. OLMTSP26]PIJ93103.1 hypothetical protein BL249_05100 [Erwinia sp. OLFS4]